MAEILKAHLSDMKSWREGVVVAEKEFNPGIAPFRLEVKRVPVPVTHSYHFIVSLYRGEYVVTSQRVFWPDYTPTSVSLSWSCIDHFTVTFDKDHEVSCDWKWGRTANWSISDGASRNTAGLSPYYFTPRLPPPSGCSVDSKGL
jgi:hypothetical protein